MPTSYDNDDEECWDDRRLDQEDDSRWSWNMDAFDECEAEDQIKREEPEDLDEAWDLAACQRDNDDTDTAPTRITAALTSRQLVALGLKTGRKQGVCCVETPDGDIEIIEPRPPVTEWN